MGSVGHWERIGKVIGEIFGGVCGGHYIYFYGHIIYRAIEFDLVWCICRGLFSMR